MADVKNHGWEHHSRVSTVLGTIGAGSVDYELIAPLRFFDHDLRVRESHHDLGLCCAAGKPGRSNAEPAEAVRHLQHM